MTTGTPEVGPSRSSRTRDGVHQSSSAHDGYRPNCLTTCGTQLAYRFNRRTAQPLGPSPAPGCDEPTSRCQTLPSMWPLGQDQPVIPGGPFIREATALPLGTVGSLGAAVAPARPVRLAVKLPCCPCALRPIAIRPEGTVGRLRYSLGGDRPSQTPHQPRSACHQA